MQHLLLYYYLATMTMNFLVFPILLLSVFGHPISDFEKDEFIIGGFIADDQQFPYMASLRFNDRHFCAATIINRQWVLTAAHCTFVPYIDQIEVVVGTNSLLFGGKRYGTSLVMPHENYVRAQLFIINDVALIKISEEFEFDSSTQPITLCETRPLPYDPAVVVGWGLFVKDLNLVSNELRYLNTTILNSSECIENNFPVLVMANEICAQSEYGKGACNGDSGGPLVFNNTHIGIVSWGIGCAVGHPDVYASSCAHLDWINSVIENNSK